MRARCMSALSGWMFDVLVMVVASERHAERHHVQRRRWDVLEKRPHLRIEPCIVARLWIERREILVHPLPDVVTRERETRRRCAA